MIQNRKFAIAFRIVSLIFSVVGVLAQIGVFSGNVRISFFMYYTIQSNVLAIVLFSLLAVRTIKSIQKEGSQGHTGWYPVFGMVSVVSLLVTMIVYWVLLSPTSTFNLWTFENIATHGITPILVLLDYILFTKGGHLKYRHLYYSAIFPMGFVIFTYSAVWLGYVYELSNGTSAKFPYFFLDYEKQGLWVIAYLVGLIVFFILLAHIMYFIDRKVRKHP